MKPEFRSKQGNRNHWEIIIDGEKWREVHRTIFGAKPAFPPFTLQDDLQSIFDDYEFRRVKGYLLWRLSKQSMHSEQIIKQLGARLVQPDTIDRIVEELQQNGMIDDEAWLRNFIGSNGKKAGLPVILNKLRAKGLSRETIGHLSAEWENPEGEYEAIQRLLNTRYRNKDLCQYDERKKAIASLLRKGFALAQVKAAIAARIKLNGSIQDDFEEEIPI